MSPTLPDPRDPARLPDLSRPHLTDTMPEPEPTATLRAQARVVAVDCFRRIAPTIKWRL